ncbi:hypothetical protein [Flagellimonas eckloniae]|uniref:Uncharacterized protein n=1 Tax=Flagellimonas eckloniae TaxID=346185 RepID=A0A0N8WFK7_9FLAO|nr:hypothetical protein [Allomuricauda eckloniae]KQC28971.1 hypothetical protein AAY42_02985 [Allomuricauda eckloniae]
MDCSKKTFINSYFQLFSFLVGFLLNFVLCHGQISEKERDYYLLFDDFIGVDNTNLYQGVLYVKEYRTINENTQFFRSDDFLSGSIDYNGQMYFDLDLKYDVYNDELLLKIIQKAGGGTIKLFKENIESFEIEGRVFEQIYAESLPTGFYEVLVKNAFFTLYAKRVKKKFERKDTFIFDEFLDGRSEYVLCYTNKYVLLKSKKSITGLFPEFKNDINEYYRKVNWRTKTDTDGFHIGLMKRIEIQLSNTKKPLVK